RQPDDRLAAAELLAMSWRYLVPESGEPGANAVGDRSFEQHMRAFGVTKSRRVHRLLHVHTEHQQVEQKLNMPLCLHRAAHEPKAHPRLVAAAIRLWIGGGLRHEAGNQRVKRTLPRRHGVGEPRFQGEARTTILKGEAQAGYDDAGPKLIEQAVDEGHHIASAIRDR